MEMECINIGTRSLASLPISTPIGTPIDTTRCYHFISVAIFLVDSDGPQLRGLPAHTDRSNAAELRRWRYICGRPISRSRSHSGNDLEGIRCHPSSPHRPRQVRRFLNTSKSREQRIVVKNWVIMKGYTKFRLTSNSNLSFRLTTFDLKWPLLGYIVELIFEMPSYFLCEFGRGTYWKWLHNECITAEYAEVEKWQNVCFGYFS